MELLGVVPLYLPDIKIQNLVSYLLRNNLPTVFFLNSPIQVAVQDLLMSSSLSMFMAIVITKALQLPITVR